MKEVLSENNIKYAYVDVCEGVGKLKMFLTLRDTREEFAQVRQEHRVGIPCLVIDDDRRTAKEACCRAKIQISGNCNKIVEIKALRSSVEIRYTGDVVLIESGG